MRQQPYDTLSANLSVRPPVPPVGHRPLDAQREIEGQDAPLVRQHRSSPPHPQAQRRPRLVRLPRMEGRSREHLERHALAYNAGTLLRPREVGVLCLLVTVVGWDPNWPVMAGGRRFMPRSVGAI
jgi:hypothetical protein